LLFSPQTPLGEKQRMTKVTRLLRLLRAHGLIAKVPRTHRYQLTPRGQTTIPALLAARAANTQKLTELAA
jgi:DNA-binding IclR family transcriptional regulator